MSNHNINIPLQNIPNVFNEPITVDDSRKSIRRYILRKYTGEIFEVNKSTYDRVKNSAFFDSLIINWYIQGTKEYVRTQNNKELERAGRRLNGIKKIIVNPLQFYQNDTGT